MFVVYNAAKEALMDPETHHVSLPRVCLAGSIAGNQQHEHTHTHTHMNTHTPPHTLTPHTHTQAWRRRRSLRRWS
jgi:hypothetical protein